jgi:hypothetical protein
MHRKVPAENLASQGSSRKRVRGQTRAVAGLNMSALTRERVRQFEGQALARLSALRDLISLAA